MKKSLWRRIGLVAYIVSLLWTSGFLLSLALPTTWGLVFLGLSAFALAIIELQGAPKVW
jgi:hypothetical protein